VPPAAMGYRTNEASPQTDEMYGVRPDA
jgi:hypothetical protein